MLDYLHVLTFFSWIPLALLAGTQRVHRDAARFLWILCGVTFLLCGYVLYLDFVWSKTVVAPIRVDLLLLVPLGTVTFTAVGVWGLRQPGALPKVASALLLVFSLPTLLVFAQAMWKSSRNIALLNTRPALFFEAQFRNPQTFRNFFGNIDGKVDPRMGHFRAENPKSWASRVIINDRGHFWLMFNCHPNVECVYAEADLGDMPLQGTFSATPMAGPPRDFAVAAHGRDRFTVTVPPNRTDTYARAPVPYREAAPAPGAVTFHGSFYGTRLSRDTLYLVQIWLWQSGDRWAAYYVRQGILCGTTNNFVFASAYRGHPVPDRIDFRHAEGNGGIEEFRIRAPAPGSDQIDAEIFYNGKPLETVALRRGGILRAPIYDSAPLADFDATGVWLKTVSMGYTLPWKAECAASQPSLPSMPR